MDIQTALQTAKEQFATVSDSASLDAQLLLCEILKVDRSYILAHTEQILSAEQESQFIDLCQRRASGEPMAYILGRRAFYDRDFAVAPGVLIPRPETELLLEQALEFVREKTDARVVDVGTGSGALAVTLAANCPQATVYAVDVSRAALMMARYNAYLHEADITFYEGDLLHPLIERNIQVDVVMANLPYIATDELADLEVSRYEPRLALDGGDDGLDSIRRLLADVPQVCAVGSLVLLEIGADQGQAVLQLAKTTLQPQSAELFQDYAGLDRIVRVLL